MTVACGRESSRLLLWMQVLETSIYLGRLPTPFSSTLAMTETTGMDCQRKEMVGICTDLCWEALARLLQMFPQNLHILVKPHNTKDFIRIVWSRPGFRFEQVSAEKYQTRRLNINLYSCHLQDDALRPAQHADGDEDWLQHVS